MLSSIDNLFLKLEGKKKSTTKKAAPKRKRATKATLGATGTKYHKPLSGATKKAAPKRKRTTSASNKGAQKLKAITAKAKEIRRAHPAKKWTACISEASRMLK